MSNQQEYTSNRCNFINEKDSKVVEISHKTPQSESALIRGERLNSSKPGRFDNDNVHVDNNGMIVDSMEHTNQHEGLRDDSLAFRHNSNNLENLHSYQYTEGNVNPYNTLADDNLYQTSNILGTTNHGYNDGEASFTK